MAEKSDEAAYYMLDLAALPDGPYADEVPVEKWLERCETAGPEGFPPGSLAQVGPCERHVEIERMFGIALYMLMNVLPFALVPFIVLLIRGWLIAKLFFAYLVVLVVSSYAYALLYPQKTLKGIREKQYVYMERNVQKYLSMRWVWHKALHFPAVDKTPLIFSMAPHGVAPMGTTAYPLFSKLFNRRLNHPTSAPVVLKLPIVGAMLRSIGYIPAKANVIKDTLAKKEESVSVILDGIAGMFQQDEAVEKLWLQERKGICKIALQTGCPIVPVYGFGHTTLWTVVADPFGLLEKLSLYLNVSICPFYGRFGWPMGPCQRQAVTVAFGEPISAPEPIENPTNEQINEHHAKMIEGFRTVFETHKLAYGWGMKNVEFI